MTDVQTEPIPEFDVDELHLRLQTPDQADEYFKLMKQNVDYLEPWTSSYYRTVDEASNIEVMAETFREYQEGSAYVFGVYDAGQLCGVVDIRGLNEEAGPVVGYWIDEAHRGKDIAPRAMLGVIDFVQAIHPFGSVDLHTNIDNKASVRVAEKMGFVLQGEAVLNGKQKKHFRKEMPVREPASTS